MIEPELLLFVEPENAPSEEPVIDALTKKMVAAFRKGEKGLEVKKEKSKQMEEKMGKVLDIEVIKLPNNKIYNFSRNNFYMGIHLCICGACSEAYNYLLPNGEITNSLCVHYLAFHREEISEEQLDRVKSLGDGEEDPTPEELCFPREKGKIRKLINRKEESLFKYDIFGKRTIFGD